MEVENFTKKALQWYDYDWLCVDLFGMLNFEARILFMVYVCDEFFNFFLRWGVGLGGFGGFTAAMCIVLVVLKGLYYGI